MLGLGLSITKAYRTACLLTITSRVLYSIIYLSYIWWSLALMSVNKLIFHTCMRVANLNRLLTGHLVELPAPRSDVSSLCSLFVTADTTSWPCLSSFKML